MLYKKLLQTFVGIVNAQLLEAVRLKVFEPEYVQNPNGQFFRSFFGSVNGAVYLIHNHCEYFAINRLDESVASLDCLFFGNTRYNSFALNDNRLSGQGIAQRAPSHSQQCGYST